MKNNKSGLIKNYHDFFNRKIKEKYTLFGGKKFGKYESWHSNGQLKYRGNFHKDIKEGNHKEWDENGELVFEKSYPITHDYSDNNEEVSEYVSYGKTISKRLLMLIILIISLTCILFITETSDESNKQNMRYLGIIVLFGIYRALKKWVY